jgi:hypothetical protein
MDVKRSPKFTARAIVHFIVFLCLKLYEYPEYPDYEALVVNIAAEQSARFHDALQW